MPEEAENRSDWSLEQEHGHITKRQRHRMRLLLVHMKRLRDTSCEGESIVGYVRDFGLLRAYYEIAVFNLDKLLKRSSSMVKRAPRRNIHATLGIEAMRSNLQGIISNLEEAVDCESSDWEGPLVKTVEELSALRESCLQSLQMIDRFEAP